MCGNGWPHTALVPTPRMKLVGKAAILRPGYSDLMTRILFSPAWGVVRLIRMAFLANLSLFGDSSRADQQGVLSASVPTCSCCYAVM